MKMKLSMSTVKSVAKTSWKFVEKNAPAIAAGAAIATMIGAVWQAIKEAPKCKEALEEAEILKNEQALKERMEDGNDETPIVKLTWAEKASIYVKHYWKVILLVLLSAGGMIVSVTSGNHKIRAMAVIAAAAEANADNLEKAAKEVVGDKKFAQIRDKVLDNQTEATELTDKDVFNTGNGKELILEPWFGQYFYSTISAADAAVNSFKSAYLSDTEAMMDEFYRMNGFPSDRIPKCAEDMGYFYDVDEQVEYPPKFQPSSKLVTLNGVKTTVYVVDLGRPRTRDDLVNEQAAKRSFRQW